MFAGPQEFPGPQWTERTPGRGFPGSPAKGGAVAAAGPVLSLEAMARIRISREQPDVEVRTEA